MIVERAAAVVFLMDPPQACPDCGRPAEWIALGVSGCPARCGASGGAQILDALDAVAVYRADLPRLAEVRAAAAAAQIPARPAPSRATP